MSTTVRTQFDVNFMFLSQNYFNEIQKINLNNKEN